MKRLIPHLLALMTLATGLVAQGASAQFHEYVAVAVDGESKASGTPNISAEECEGTFEFTLSNYNMGEAVQFVEVWASTSDNDCNEPDARSNVNKPQGAACWLVDTLESVLGTRTYETTGAKLFPSDRTSDTGVCLGAQNSKYTVYFVPLENRTNQNSPSEAKSGVQQLYATFKLFTTPPDAPTGLKGLTGENVLGLEWTPASSTNANSTYQVYFDTDASDTGDGCTSSSLVAGADPPSAGGTVSMKPESGSSSSLSSLDSRGVEIGDVVAAAVATKDVAENIGPLSEVVCIQRVTTTGFWDACQDDPDCKDGFDKCSLSPGSSGLLASLTSILLIGLALAVGRGRKS